MVPDVHQDKLHLLTPSTLLEAMLALRANWYLPIQTEADSLLVDGHAVRSATMPRVFGYTSAQPLPSQMRTGVMNLSSLFPIRHGMLIIIERAYLAFASSMIVL